jgi:hypothetical protein
LIRSLPCATNSGKSGVGRQKKIAQKPPLQADFRLLPLKHWPADPLANWPLSESNFVATVSARTAPNISTRNEEYMTDVKFLTKAELEAGLPTIRRSPQDEGELQLIVRRPKINAREVLTEAEFDTVVGLVGDTWKDRRSSRTADGSPHPDMQLNIINTRLIGLLAPDEARWQLAGDQLFLDLDLGFVQK